MIVYKLKYNMAFQKLGDEYICVAVGPDADRYQNILRLNETAMRVVSLLNEPCSVGKVTEILSEEYEADKGCIREVVQCTVDGLDDVIEKQEV